MGNIVIRLAALVVLYLAFSPSPVSKSVTDELLASLDPRSALVAGLRTSIVAVTTGSQHTCALTSAGGLKCWGQNSAGQLGVATGSERAEPVDVIGLASGVVAVAAGGWHTCALTSAGGVKCWGQNSYGQLGDGTKTSHSTATDVLTLTSGVAAIAAGESHTCAITVSGALRCWGLNTHGEVGDGTTANRTVPTAVSGLSAGIADVSAGKMHTCAVTAAGAAKCWGANVYGQLGDGTHSGRLVPADVPGLTSGVTAVSAGGFHTCALNSGGTLKCWGQNASGQLGDETSTDQSTPVPVHRLASAALSVTAGDRHTCAVMTGGSVACWGYNGLGQLGDGTFAGRSRPQAVANVSNAVAAEAGVDHTCAIVSGGGLRCWGGNAAGQLGAGPGIQRATPAIVAASGGTAISAGSYHSCAVLASGIGCWGSNTTGQLGDGSYTSRSTPAAIAGTSGWLTVSTGVYHSCSLTAEGGVRCWGGNSAGQLGDGTKVSRNTPGDVTGLATGVVAVNAGGMHTCAVTVAGAALCWGDNQYGQLGDGTKTNHSAPGLVSGLSSGVVAISAGTYHTCAVTGSGAVKCWGSNGYGQTGVPAGTSSLSPVNVEGLPPGIIAISAGGLHTCARTTDGVAVCWGANTNGQLGDGTQAARHTPQPVSGLASALVWLTAAFGHTCAVMSSGSVKCWGGNEYGQVGDGTTAMRILPADVKGIRTATVVSGGAFHTCARLSDGTMQCWGRDAEGQLGANRILASAMPVSAIGLSRGSAPAFTDDPIVAGTTAVKGIHLAELRAAVDLLRTGNGLPPFAWMDVALSPGSSMVKATHFAELRFALDEACIAAGLSVPEYSSGPISAGGTVLAVHLAELRAAVLDAW